MFIPTPSAGSIPKLIGIPDTSCVIQIILGIEMKGASVIYEYAIDPGLNLA
jgi:hypothetical protein